MLLHLAGESIVVNTLITNALVLGEFQRTSQAIVLYPGAKKPLPLVLEDLIGVIIYHVNRKVFLN